jgi:rare lipoprotein A
LLREITLAAVIAASPHKASAECGVASWYDLGGRTASGEKMNGKRRTAAHRTIKFGTVLRVTNPANGKVTEVIVNDRGPFTRGRVLDLSRAAANDLGVVSKGHARVCFSRR